MQRHPYDPAYNFEAGIAKWIDVQLSGILWYQGESNVHNIEHHSYLFPRFVQSWREAFKQDLPFYFVQLSSMNRPSWGHFRDSQRQLTKELDKVFMAISYDVGDSLDVHPTDKKTVGIRLANLALKHQYKYAFQADSPQPKTVVKKNGTIEIIFDHANQLKTTNTSQLLELAYVLANGQIQAISDAQILKNKLIIPSKGKEITHIQYAYKPFSRGNLVNEAGVPVSTFSVKIDH